MYKNTHDVFVCNKTQVSLPKQLHVFLPASRHVFLFRQRTCILFHMNTGPLYQQEDTFCNKTRLLAGLFFLSNRKTRHLFQQSCSARGHVNLLYFVRGRLLLFYRNTGLLVQQEDMSPCLADKENCPLLLQECVSSCPPRRRAFLLRKTSCFLLGDRPDGI